MRADTARKLGALALNPNDARVNPLACTEGTEKAVAVAYERWKERRKMKAEESRKRLKDEIKRRKEA